MRVLHLVFSLALATPALANTAPAATKPLPVATLSYDDLKKSYRVDDNVSLAIVRADVATSSGRVIEIRGVVNGMMKTPAGQTVILNSSEGTAVARLAAEASGTESLRAGTSVRALLLVAPPNSQIAFTLLAASASTAGDSLFRSPYGDEPVIVPQSTDVALPQPKSATPIVPRGRSGALPARVPGLDASNFEVQQSAYKHLARRFNRKLTEAQADEIAGALLRAGGESNLDSRFLAAIIAVESDFDIYCLSSSGAMGLGQLMPFNLKEAGITNAWNPTQNIVGMARLLRGHLNDYAGRPDATLLAVAAYNAGPGAVRRAGYKVPRGAQVQRYVWKVYYRYKEFAPELF